MNIFVCVKQVPDTAEVRIDPRTNTLVREGVPSIINPDDTHAVEAAVRLREEKGGRVVALSMGPPQTERALRKALSLGADEAVLLSDRAFAAADTYATTYVLALAVRRLQREAAGQTAGQVGDHGGPFLVFCGRQALDGDTGQVGPGLARRLGIPLLSYVVKIRSLDPAAQLIVVDRRLGPFIETLKTRLPALLTVDGSLNTVRYAPLPDMLRATRQPVRTWTAADLGALPDRLGMRGSPTRVVRSFVPQPRRVATEFIADGGGNAGRAAAALADRLIESGVVEPALAVEPAPVPALAMEPALTEGYDAARH